MSRLRSRRMMAMVQASLTTGRWTVAGRGELHLAILVEKMRREGFEIEVSKPQVIFKEIDGKKLEPMELASIEVPEEYSGTVIEMFGKRLGVMKDMRVDDNRMAHIDFAIPTRGLIGIRNVFLLPQRYRYHEHAFHGLRYL